MIQIIRCRLSRTDAWDEAAVFFQILCHIRYLYSNRSIEVGKEDDEQHIKRCLQRRPPLQVTGNGLYPGYINELGNGYWKHQHG